MHIDLLRIKNKDMKRKIYQKLEEWKNRKNRKPLILKGTRQVGKTYILKRFGQEAFDKFHYVNFEEDEALGQIFVYCRILAFMLNRP